MVESPSRTRTQPCPKGDALKRAFRPQRGISVIVFGQMHMHREERLRVRAYDFLYGYFCASRTIFCMDISVHREEKLRVRANDFLYGRFCLSSSSSLAYIESYFEDFQCL